MKKKNKPFFWIYGNQRESRRSWDNLIEHVESDTGEKPNIEVMFAGFNPVDTGKSGRWATAQDVILTLRNKDMFDSRPRILKVCGLPEGYTGLADWFKIINSSNILVLSSDFGHTKLGSKRWITAKTSKLFKKVKKEGFLIEHPTDAKSDSDAVAWVEDVASECGKEIKRVVAREVVLAQGRNLDILTNSVEKIATYKRGKVITTEDVHSCCFVDFSDAKVWKFVEDLDYQRPKEALAYLQTFYAEGDGLVGESFYGRVSKLFGALSQHFQFLLMMKDNCPNGAMNEEIIKKALSSFKKMSPSKIEELKKNIISYDELEPKFSRYYIERNMRSESVRCALRRKKSAIYHIVFDLYECMFLCRVHSGDDCYIRLCLDTFVLLVCGNLSKRDVSAVRGK